MNQAFMTRKLLPPLAEAPSLHPTCSLALQTANMLLTRVVIIRSASIILYVCLSSLFLYCQHLHGGVHKVSVEVTRAKVPPHGCESR